MKRESKTGPSREGEPPHLTQAVIEGDPKLSL